VTCPAASALLPANRRMPLSVCYVVELKSDWGGSSGAAKRAWYGLSSRPIELLAG